MVRLLPAGSLGGAFCARNLRDYTPQTVQEKDRSLQTTTGNLSQSLWLFHDGQVSRRGYAVLRGQVVSGCGWAWGCPGCGELWCFLQSGAMVPPAASKQKSPSASSCTTSMGTSSITFPTWMSQWMYVYFWNIHVFAHGPTPGCTSDSDIHMKISLHTHEYVVRSIRVHKSTYFYTYVSYTHVWIFFFTNNISKCLFIYLHVLIQVCLYVCTYVCMYVYVKCV